MKPNVLIKNYGLQRTEVHSLQHNACNPPCYLCLFLFCPLKNKENKCLPVIEFHDNRGVETNVQN